MNIKGFRRMLFGEKMPDKNDPKYKERYERDVDAGRRFAKATRIDKAVAKVQGFANAHRTLFLVIVKSRNNTNGASGSWPRIPSWTRQTTKRPARPTQRVTGRQTDLLSNEV